jgi:ABC-type phosphate transport system substrate-binding protein
MRTYKKLIAAAAVVAPVIAIAVVPALADPPSGAAPQNSIVGTGSNTIQNVFDQFSVVYKAPKGAKGAAADPLVSWDAVGPTGKGLPAKDTGDIVTKGPVKASSPCLVLRPNGSGAGVAYLAANTANKKSNTGFCADFARSSSGPSATTPPGMQFVPLAKDNVTWASNAVTNAPAHLTLSQLLGIYTCKFTNWKQVGGKNAPIDAQLPQVSSGTRKFFLTILGSGTPITPGACVNSSKGESDTTPPPVGNFPEENEGYNPFLKGPNVIYPFSTAQWIADGNSASCKKAGCPFVNKPPFTPPACKTPGPKQLLFGCNYRVNMILRSIKVGKKVYSPLTAKLAQNPAFSATGFQRTVFVVVRAAKGQPGLVPAYLQNLFGPKKSSFINSAVAAAWFKAYGFLPL